MAESKLQYKCERHGAQVNGLMITINLADGSAHTLNHCLVCVAEMFARNGVGLMTPVLITEDAKAEVETKWELE